jgi:hypothetical protein
MSEQRINQISGQHRFIVIIAERNKGQIALFKPGFSAGQYILAFVVNDTD